MFEQKQDSEVNTGGDPRQGVTITQTDNGTFLTLPTNSTLNPGWECQGKPCLETGALKDISIPLDGTPADINHERTRKQVNDRFKRSWAQQYKQDMTNLSHKYSSDMNRLETQNKQLRSLVTRLSGQVSSLNGQIEKLSDSNSKIIEIFQESEEL